MALELQIVTVTLTFNGGLITDALVGYNLAGSSVISGPGTFNWVLTTAEQTAAVTTGFVTALVNKLNTISGMTVVTE